MTASVGTDPGEELSSGALRLLEFEHQNGEHSTPVPLCPMCRDSGCTTEDKPGDPG